MSMRASSPRRVHLDESVAAQKLHEGLCQTLTGLHLHASVIGRHAKKSSPQLGKELEELQALIEQARVECYEVLKLLRKKDHKKPPRQTRHQASPSR